MKDEEKDERSPILDSWRNVYIFVILVLVLVMVLLFALKNHYE